MDTILLIIFGAIALFSTYKLYKYLQREELQKEETYRIVTELQNLIKVHHEDAHEIMIMRDIINQRKQQYLYDCFVSRQILPEPKENWLSSEELRLHKLNNEKRWEDIKRINKHFKQ